MYYMYLPWVKLSFLLEDASNFKWLTTPIKTSYTTIPTFFLFFPYFHLSLGVHYDCWKLHTNNSTDRDKEFKICVTVLQSHFWQTEMFIQGLKCSAVTWILSSCIRKVVTASVILGLINFSAQSILISCKLFLKFPQDDVVVLMKYIILVFYIM